MDKQKIIDFFKRFYSDHKYLCRTALIYLAVILVSAVYTPWTNNEYSREFAETITSLKHSSNITIKLIFNVLYVGMADLMELAVYDLYQDEEGSFMLIFLCLFSVQKIIADKISRRSHFRNKLEELAVDNMMGNIIFAVSAYVIYFLNILFVKYFYGLDDVPFVLVGVVLLILLAMFMLAGMSYLFVYMTVFYQIIHNIEAVNYFFARLAGGRAVIAAPIILVSMILLSLLTEWAAGKIHDLILKANGELVTKFLPFLSPVYEFLSD